MAHRACRVAHPKVMEDCQAESGGVQNELRRVVDTLPGLVWTALPDGRIDFVNQRWFEYTGLSVDVVYDQACQPAIHPEDLPEMLESWRSIRASGEPGEIEARFRRFDGEYRWFLIHTSPLCDAAGQVVKWVGVNTDIEDRRRAEALLAGEKRLLEIVASGGALPVVLDALCSLLDATAEGCFSSVLLLDRAGTKIAYAAAPGLPPSYKEFLKGRPVTCEEGPCGMSVTLNKQVIVSDVGSDARWESGGYPAAALSYGVKSYWSSPIRSLTGELLGTFAITRRDAGSPTPFHQVLIEQFTHIASIAIERTRNEEALKRNETFLAKAQHLSSTGSFAWRVATNDITWSDEVYRIFGLRPAVTLTPELIGTRIHPEDIPLWAESIDHARRKGTDYECEHRLLLPDNSVKYLRMVAHSTRDQEGQVEYIGAIQDVTDHRLSEEALDKVRSELAYVARITSLGAMTASIAHEISQPLSGVITNANTCLRMLAADPPNLDGARETARRTLRDGNRASDVITRLRALFSKKSATRELMNLNEATREVIALSLSELQRSRVILRAELADDLPPVTGDRVQLQQVILNLLLNASDAMSGVHDRPRQLVIRTEGDEGDRVRLSVQDAGVGLKREDVDRLFEAFYTTKAGGMGIGLSVSRCIIESHDGRLWASPNNGPGATFSFSIPRRGDSSGAIQTPAATDTEHIMRNSR
jgi:PAS domain S-box-containing protein